MGWLATEKAPSKWSASYFKLFVERVRTAVNNIDSENFPEGLSGSILKDKTVNTGALTSFEYEIVFFALAEPYTTTSLTSKTVGGLVRWNVSSWGTDAVKLVFEVAGGVSNASATATFEVHGMDGIVASIDSKVVSLENLRSNAFSPPSEDQTLAFKMKTSNASYTAQAISAKLIIVPS